MNTKTEATVRDLTTSVGRRTLILCAVASLCYGLAAGYSMGDVPSAARPDRALLVAAFATGGLGLIAGKDSAGYMWIYNYIFQACNATMFSLLAFFIASASFRAFRVRNLEAGLLLGAAVMVMFGRLSMAEAVWGGFLDLAEWTLDFPNNAGKRAILIGIALGACSTGLRVILGLERSHLGGE